MNETIEKLDGIMGRASQALADMDYLGCEVLCLEALAEARGVKRFGYYARVLMPLQEARRQRRMIAAQGDILLGTAEPGFDVGRWLTGQRAGCIVLTHPHTAKDAKSLADRAYDEKKFIEILFADNAPDAETWTLRSYDGPEISCEVQAPTPGSPDSPGSHDSPASPNEDPAQWFLHATEQLGDAALRSTDDSLSGGALVLELEVRLRIFPDHELLHQRLAEAARTVV